MNDESGKSREEELGAAASKAPGKPARPSILRETPLGPGPLEPTEDIIEGRLAEEIDFARRLLEAVGDELICDPSILARHQRTLQSFDIVGQLLGHLARVAGAKDKAEAISRIGMQELRSRLCRPTDTLLNTGTIGSFQRSPSNPFR